MDGLTRRLAALITVATLALAALPSVAAASPSDESHLVGLINQARQGAGLAPLTPYDDLVDDARRHSREMMAQGTIFHSSNSQLAAVTTGWSLLGENVGMGPDPATLHTAFMNSPSHRANVLGAFHRVGVGAERAADGTLFITVIFMQVAGPAPTTTTTAAPTTTTTAARPQAPAAQTTASPTAPPSSPPTTTTAPAASAPTAGGDPAGPSSGRSASLPSAEVRHQTVTAVPLPSLAVHHRPTGLCVRIKADGRICIE